MEEWVSPSRLAELLGTTIGALEGLRRRGQGIPYLMEGRMIKYKLEEVDKYLARKLYMEQKEWKTPRGYKYGWKR